MSQHVCLFGITAMFMVQAAPLGATGESWRGHLDASWQFEREGNLAGAQGEFESALREARTMKDSAAMADVLEEMGRFHDNIGSFGEAQSNYQDALAIWRRRLGLDDVALLRVINRLAAVYLETGQLGKAEGLHLDDWRERLKVDAAGRDELLPLLQNVATLDSKRGRFDQALSAFEEALAIIRQRGGQRSAEEAAARNNLGLACSRAKRYELSIEHLLTAVTLWEKLRGPDSLNTGLAAYNLAVAYEGAGRLDEAEARMEQALAAVERSCGATSLRTANVLSSYAALLRRMRRKVEARVMSGRAQRIFKEERSEAPARWVVDAGDFRR